MLIYEFPKKQYRVEMIDTSYSALLEHYGYLVQTEMLLVKIKKEVLFAFKGVSLAFFRRMRAAPSVDKFFLREVRDRFPYERVAPTAYRVIPDAPAPAGAPPAPLLPPLDLALLAHLPDAWL